MPKMSGIELTVRLKEIEPKVRIVFSSGYASYSMKDIKETGADAFISKPYQERVLADTVRKLLDAEKR